MLRLAEPGEVLSMVERPRLVQNELVQLRQPLEDMGLYRWSEHMYRMADIVIGKHSQPDEVISLIAARPLIRKDNEPAVRLLTADSVALAALRSQVSLAAIRAGGHGFINVSDPGQPSTRIGVDGDFGSEWYGANKRASLLAMVSILGNGFVEIDDKAPGGVNVRANWAGSERYCSTKPVAQTESEVAEIVIRLLPLQRKRLS